MKNWSTKEVVASAVTAAIGAMFVWSALFSAVPGPDHDIALKLGCAFTAFACATWPRPLFEPATWHIAFRGLGPPTVLGSALSIAGLGCFAYAAALWVVAAA
ncbi:MAG TPA: hypothetical protein VFR86_17400 [Burkholderiaceae bacterium]|nr:hypothetical protein [Burkholderiaceae bacterium]